MTTMPVKELKLYDTVLELLEQLRQNRELQREVCALQADNSLLQSVVSQLKARVQCYEREWRPQLEYMQAQLAIHQSTTYK